MIRVSRTLALAMLLGAVARPVWAAGDEDEEKASDEESDEESSDEETSDEEPSDEDEKPDKGGKGDKGDKASKAAKADKGSSEEDSGSDDEEATDDDGLPVKQNLNGHDLANTTKQKGEFERDRFFVDKVDDEKTEKGTLVQGSIASSTFFYGESGGAYPNLMGPADNSDAGNKRLFTELRLQTDFRHISGSRWEARLDARARAVNHPDNETFTDGNGATQTTTPNRIQAGLYGENEYELRELWLIHSGERADTYIGRQFIPDLGGIKIDGIRVDYAKSSKVTLLGFGGLMPVRGSRSITTDYPKLVNADGKSAGRYVAAGGFGAAYRTVSSYGALGAVTQLPVKLSAEKPRLYVTTNGYLRSGPSLDVYHYVLVDLYGSSAENATGKIQLTNLSGGVNFKPNARLRLTAAFHRVDTETLGVQAGAFLQQPDPAGVGNTVIQNEAYLQRIATNTARAGVSAGLGAQQRFEVSTALSYRVRPTFTLTSPDKTVQVELPQASSVEVWASFVDRHSIKDARIGLEVSRSFGVGDLAYQRSIALISRLYVRRDFADGRGEWEAEAGFSDIRDTVLAKGSLGCGTDMMTGNPLYYECYGTSNNTLISAGGELFYRLKKDWMTIATLYLLRTTNKRSDAVEDPAITGLTGFLRIAKRF